MSEEPSVMDNETIQPIIEMVREFRIAMGQEPDLDRAKTLIKEEYAELVDSLMQFEETPVQENLENLLKEAADLLYVIVGAYEQSGALGVLEHDKIPPGDTDFDRMMVHIQILSENMFRAGLLNDEVFSQAVRLVHLSNMTKLGDDGEPVRREDGKIIKGPNYMPPDLSRLAEDILVSIEAPEWAFRPMDEKAEAEAICRIQTGQGYLGIY